MKTRDLIILVIVLAGIGWLIFDNYKRTQTPAEKPATVEQTKPVQK